MGVPRRPQRKPRAPVVVSWLRDEVKRRMARLTLDEMYYDSMKAATNPQPAFSAEYSSSARSRLRLD